MSSPEISGKLQDDLRSAVAAELTTLPTYLYTYWTIKPAKYGGSITAEQTRTTIMSVILEEMLHMALSSNILNALGGSPDFTSAPFVPQYPCYLLRSPHHDPQGWGALVELRRLSVQSIDNFLAIELPEYDEPCGPTLGYFYNDIVAPELPPNGPQWEHGRQFCEFNNPGPGRLFPIRSRDDATTAIKEIVDQGEGTDPKHHDDGDHELAHYWKFKTVEQAILNGHLELQNDVYPVIDQPGENVAHYTPEQQRANRAFNSTYSQLLDTLEATLRTESPNVFAGSTGLMERLGQQAAVLRQQGNVPGTQLFAGPTFDYLPAEQRVSV